MASRFAHSSLHQRDPRSDLFKGYSGSSAAERRSANASPARYGGGGGYGYGGGGSVGGSSYGGSYNGSSSSTLGVSERIGGGFRSATPNSKGQYSDAVLNELESQNDEQVEGIMGKVKILKDMTIAIGDEIRDSSALAEKMNESFDQTRLRLRGTMNRMLIMAQKSGVGWRMWLAFFAAVVFLFFYVRYL